MRKSYKFLWALFSVVPAFLFSQADVPDAAILQKIRDEALNRSQIPFIAHQLTDVSGARLTNSPGYKRASEWAVKTMKSWGLANAQLEPWGEFGKGWELQKSYVAMKAPYYQPMIAYPYAWSGPSKGLVQSSVIWLDKLDSATIQKMAPQLKGKIVLVGDGLPLRSAFTAYASRYTDSNLVNMGDMFWFTRATAELFIPSMHKREDTKAYLLKQGIVALIAKNNNGRDGTIFVDGTRAFKKDIAPGVPEIVLSTEDFLRIERLVKDGVDVQLEMDIKTAFYSDDLKGYNVVAEIPGTDPTLKSELVMLGGHLDSWHSGTGATDNGAGCIVMMEVMRIIKTLGLQPRRTIRIALWGGEEQGLLGSHGYATNHFGDPATMQLKPEQDKVSAYYNLDNGSGKIRGIFTQGNESIAPIFKKWLEPYADLGASTVSLKNTGSTDHQSFEAVGIPGFQFIQDPIEYLTRTHHSNMDTYDHLQLDDLKQAATIIAGFVYNTAMRDEKMPRKPLPKPEKWLFDGF